MKLIAWLKLGAVLGLKELDDKFSQCYWVDIRELTIARVQALFKENTLDPIRLVECYLARIKAMDPYLNSVIEVNPAALEEARKLSRMDSWKPLYGIPILVKDNFATVDAMATTAGSFALLHQRPTSEATAVRRLRRAGAIVLGKANMSEFSGLRTSKAPRGWSARGNRTSNAYVRSKSSGGSSSGSAVAVAANLCMAAIGTETDGSIIGPASVNGIVGMKASINAIPIDGIIPLSLHQDAVGVLARTVEDAFVVYACLDNKESSRIQTFPRKAYLDQQLAPLPTTTRVGIISDDYYWHELTDSIIPLRQFIERANVQLERAISMDITNIDEDSEIEVVLTEFKHTLNNYLRLNCTSFQKDSPIRSLDDIIKFYQARPELDPNGYGYDLLVRSNKTDITSERYQSLVKTYREPARIAIHETLDSNHLDLLVFPSGQYEETVSPTAFVGYPIITIPAGIATNRLPFGLSIHGKDADHINIFKLALAIQNNGPEMRKPPQFFP